MLGLVLILLIVTAVSTASGNDRYSNSISICNSSENIYADKHMIPNSRLYLWDDQSDIRSIWADKHAGKSADGVTLKKWEQWHSDMNTDEPTLSMWNKMHNEAAGGRSSRSNFFSDTNIIVN
jgi:hypothetical protein